MSNGEVCCILGVCCPPGSAEQREALVHLIQKAHPNMPKSKVQAATSRVLKEHGNFKTIPKILREFAA
jgi:hypothetical protein